MTIFGKQVEFSSQNKDQKGLNLAISISEQDKSQITSQFIEFQEDLWPGKKVELSNLEFRIDAIGSNLFSQKREKLSIIVYPKSTKTIIFKNFHVFTIEKSSNFKYTHVERSIATSHCSSGIYDIDASIGFENNQYSTIAKIVCEKEFIDWDLKLNTYDPTKNVRNNTLKIKTIRKFINGKDTTYVAVVDKVTKRKNKEKLQEVKVQEMVSLGPKFTTSEYLKYVDQSFNTEGILYDSVEIKQSMSGNLVAIKKVYGQDFYEVNLFSFNRNDEETKGPVFQGLEVFHTETPFIHSLVTYQNFVMYHGDKVSYISRPIVSSKNEKTGKFDLNHRVQHNFILEQGIGEFIGFSGILYKSQTISKSNDLILNLLYKSKTGGEEDKYYKAKSYSLVSIGVQITCKPADKKLSSSHKIYFKLEYTYSYPTVENKHLLNYPKFPNNTIDNNNKSSGDYLMMILFLSVLIGSGIYCFRHMRKSQKQQDYYENNMEHMNQSYDFNT